VEDVDALAKQAVAAGAKELRPVVNQFYGDLSGTYEDPFGHVWTIATHLEDVSPEEMMKRAQQAHYLSKFPLAIERWRLSAACLQSTDRFRRTVETPPLVMVA